MQTSVTDLMASLGVVPQALQAGDLVTLSPLDGQVLAQVHTVPLADVTHTVERAQTAFLRWRTVPGP
jgi:aldehyde dehydrogenase (NAD+)